MYLDFDVIKPYLIEHLKKFYWETKAQFLSVSYAIINVGAQAPWTSLSSMSKTKRNLSKSILRFLYCFRLPTQLFSMVRDFTQYFLFNANTLKNLVKWLRMQWLKLGQYWLVPSPSSITETMFQDNTWYCFVPLGYFRLQTFVIYSLC